MNAIESLVVTWNESPNTSAYFNNFSIEGFGITWGYDIKYFIEPLILELMKALRMHSHQAVITFMHPSPKIMLTDGWDVHLRAGEFLSFEGLVTHKLVKLARKHLILLGNERFRLDVGIPLQMCQENFRWLRSIIKIDGWDIFVTMLVLLQCQL